MRLYRIDAPYVDAHSWRQVTNADIARNWTEGPIQFAKPIVSWGGPDGRLGMELPLLHLLTATVWRVAGISDAAGRLVSVAFSLGTVWLMVPLGTRLSNRGTGLGAAMLMAVSPSVVYFGRCLLSDTPMLFFSVAAVLGYVTYAQTDRLVPAVLGAVSFALAGLVKIPAILVLGPIMWIGLLCRGRSVHRDAWFTIAPALGIASMIVWYGWADVLSSRTGLTQAIFRPSGTYSSDIATLAGHFSPVSHWTRADQLNLGSFRALTTRYWELHLLYVGAIAAALGMAVSIMGWRQRWLTVIHVWMAAAISLVIVSLSGQLPHEFHQLPTLPPLALYAGLGVAPLFDERLWARLGRAGRPVAFAVLAASLAISGLVSLRSPRMRELYRLYYPNELIINAGSAINYVTPPNALIVTMEYRHGGANSPLLLYFSHRRGWSFDAESLTPEVIDYLKSQGACYFATSHSVDLPYASTVASYLADKVELELPYAHWQYRLWELGCDEKGPNRKVKGQADMRLTHEAKTAPDVGIT